MLLKAMTYPFMIYQAPPLSGELRLGLSLLDLLDQACDRAPNAQALNQWQNRQWRSLSNSELRTAAEEFALGLLSLGLHRGDRVALVMHNSIPFCIADLGSLLAGLVDVPIDLSQTIENILLILQQTEAQALIVSNQDLLNQLLPYLWDAPDLQWVIVAEAGKTQSVGAVGAQRVEVDGAGKELKVPQLLCGGENGVCPASMMPPFLQQLSWEDLQDRGRDLWTGEQVQQLRAAIAPSDLATIVYIASETKQPKGVMLSHESIAANILAAFSSFPNLGTGPQEIALLFLPLTHIFARAFLYGHLAYGHSLYLSDPNHVVKHLKTVRPTIVIAVPRLLEKIYERFLEQERRLQGFDQQVFRWSLKVAQQYRMGQPCSKFYGLQLKLANRLVLAKWRSLFGDRLKALIVGGAALKAELATVFSAAGIPVYQGYGLTETSSVLCYNRGSYNRAGTVGVPIPGVEIALAADQEILVRSPFVMQGYYHDPEATRQVLDAEGWFHTGDLGVITPEGFLKIIGVKKSLFKLTTGKYVSPLALEQDVCQSPLVAHAIAVGANQKFCSMLIFPNWKALRDFWTHGEAEPQSQEESPSHCCSMSLLSPVFLSSDASLPLSLNHPCLLALYQTLIDQANCHLPYWATVRKFKLLADDLTIESGLLQADGTIDRRQILQVFAKEIEAIYEDSEQQKQGDETSRNFSASSPVVSPCPLLPLSPTCPISAKSFIHH